MIDSTVDVAVAVAEVTAERKISRSVCFPANAHRSLTLSPPVNCQLQTGDNDEYLTAPVSKHHHDIVIANNLSIESNPRFISSKADIGEAHVGKPSTARNCC
eukprot:scaffold49788_cov64-Cyclotella_meneghiniana.AAC.3